MKLKIATSFEEQIKCLESKDIIIDNYNTCIDFLKKINYYRLSGYFLQV